MFDSTSRYFNLAPRTLEREGQDPVQYVGRRFLPNPETLQTLAELAVESADRPDLLTWRGLSDPLQFWRVADANNVMDPGELTDEPGRLVRIPIPQP